MPRLRTDRDEVRELLRRNPERHLLAIGDLDDAFWPHTQFLHGAGQTVLVYTGLQMSGSAVEGLRPARRACCGPALIWAYAGRAS